MNSAVKDYESEIFKGVVGQNQENMVEKKFNLGYDAHRNRHFCPIFG